MKIEVQKDITEELSAPVLSAWRNGKLSQLVQSKPYSPRKLERGTFRCIDLSKTGRRSQSSIEESLVKFPDGSGQVFYYVPNANVLIFEASTGPQVEGEAASELTKQILDFAEHCWA